MSGIDQFLAQHYGTLPTEPSEEDIQKVAQAEMFLKLAAKHNVDISQLDDAQINELWGRVWENKTAEAPVEKAAEEEVKKEEDKKEEAKKEHEQVKEKAQEEAKEAADKFAEVDYQGRRMAHAYVNELRSIAEAGGLDFMKQASAAPTAEPPAEKEAQVGALDELAAKHAVEKAAAAGFNAEEAAKRVDAVMLLGPGESDKIASVESTEDAIDVRSSELLELAGYPVDWTGTPFDKTAGDKANKALEVSKRVGQHVKEHVTGGGLKSIKQEAGHLLNVAKFHREGNKGAMDSALLAARHRAGHATAHAAAHGAEAAGLGAGAALVANKAHGKKETSKEASVVFDNAAAELALAKVAEAGWNPEEAVARINSLFTLGYEGDPSQSEKVASAGEDGEKALTLRACELLELAGYTINW
jgi:hypothetical protein